MTNFNKIYFMKKFNTLLLFLFILFFGCKNDGVEVKVSLTSKMWTPALIDKNTSTNPSGQVLYKAFLNCEKDDTYSFGADGKLTINRGVNQCNSSEINKEILNYTYSANTKELVINGIKYTVVDESEVQLKYYTAIPNATSFQYLIFLFN